MPTTTRPRRTSAKGRQDGDYAVQILVPAKGGPIPTTSPKESR